MWVVPSSGGQLFFYHKNTIATTLTKQLEALFMRYNFIKVDAMMYLIDLAIKDTMLQNTNISQAKAHIHKIIVRGASFPACFTSS